MACEREATSTRLFLLRMTRCVQRTLRHLAVRTDFHASMSCFFTCRRCKTTQGCQCGSGSPRTLLHAMASRPVSHVSCHVWSSWQSHAPNSGWSHLFGKAWQDSERGVDQRLTYSYRYTELATMPERQTMMHALTDSPPRSSCFARSIM